MIQLLGFAAAALLLIATPANACGWLSSQETCDFEEAARQNQIEDKRNMLRHLDQAIDRARDNAGPTTTRAEMDAEEGRKKASRAASHYRDPPGSITFEVK